MRFLSIVLLGLTALHADAGGRRRGGCANGSCGVSYGYQQQFQAQYQFQPQMIVQQPVPAQPPLTITSSTKPLVAPAPVPPAIQTEIDVKEKRNKTVVKVRTTTAALDQLNFQRAQRGLRPYIFDEGLTRAAEKCAMIKAQSCASGHLQGGMSDFSCLEPGVHAASAGADGSKIHASDPNFYTCCMYDNYTYAGAAQFVGPDGCKYMSLFVR